MGTKENDAQGPPAWDGLQGNRLALQSVHEPVSWENMQGWGVFSSETDQRRSPVGDVKPRFAVPAPKLQGAALHNGRDDARTQGLVAERGDGWVLGRQDGFGLTLEPGLAFRRGGPRFEGEASGCLPFSFQRLLGQTGGGGSGGGRGRRGKTEEGREEEQEAAGRLSICPPGSGQANTQLGGWGFTQRDWLQMCERGGSD